MYTELPFNRLRQSFVGFDDIFDQMFNENNLKPSQTYPPHNILSAKNERTSDSFTWIELAVAGFREDEINIEVNNNVLSISGKKEKESSSQENATYMHKGIATRSFKKEFTLGEHVEVTGAELDHGILSVYLKKEIPEHKKPKQIKIGAPRGDPKLLMESDE